MKLGRKSCHHFWYTLTYRCTKNDDTRKKTDLSVFFIIYIKGCTYMKELKHFPACDGHIESIVMGYRSVKISFQTWDCRKLILIYDVVESIKAQDCIFCDIDSYETSNSESEVIRYTFYTTDHLILEILAKSVQIFEVGNRADINSALFDVGYTYIGDQTSSLSASDM